MLIAIKILPERQDIPIAESGSLILPERKSIQKRLLEMEQLYDGYSLAYAGSCIYCHTGSCARKQNHPCRHPELVRPSLEAFGFDIGLTTSKLFGIELKWGKDGFVPEYLTLVSGFFHNSSEPLSFPLSTI